MSEYILRCYINCLFTEKADALRAKMKNNLLGYQQEIQENAKILREIQAAENVRFLAKEQNKDIADVCLKEYGIADAPLKLEKLVKKLENAASTFRIEENTKKKTRTDDGFSLDIDEGKIQKTVGPLLNVLELRNKLAVLKCEIEKMEIRIKKKQEVVVCFEHLESKESKSAFFYQ
eukprot:GHVN01068087.1.p3 GENE.GHVN01068087.1~~GHVN01068087.1.p3  ORF type:complete len:176 (+),score=28.51 GHVN01068087.1:1743-2270(+)